ncbi:MULTISPECIES: M23 family metallopeptidase [unclassified Roseitalea]|uniref:M23 family metallopeptidase n=1 Tax=unclassified Roseitalea TaxID=2639107 RepID=UPI00273E7D57|nr:MULTISPECIES: M23 family metallopeptidase [unclassified Roseitalea]
MKSAKRGPNGLVGDEPAIASVGERTPDRREISLRWLGGTFLTGLTSTSLMGFALFAALDGKQLLATPPEVISREAEDNGPSGDAAKAGRIVTASIPPTTADDNGRRRMSVSTVTRTGDADVVRTRPFEHLTIALAAPHQVDADYPSFNPLTIFADTDAAETETAAASSVSGLIYGASVETGAAIRMSELVYESGGADQGRFEISEWEAEQAVRAQAEVLTAGTVEIASLQYVDPRRFGLDDALRADIAEIGNGARILTQNISVAEPDREHAEPHYGEDLIEIHDNANIAAVMEDAGHDGGARMARALETLLNTQTLKAGHAIRLGLQKPAQSETGAIVRATVYSGDNHVLTIALNDQQQFVPAPEPVDPGIMVMRGKQDTVPAIVPARERPSVYDAIWRGVLAYDMPDAVAAKIVRMVASDVDFRSPVGAEDSLELFYSVPEEGADEPREVLFVRATFGGQSRKFYKFVDPDGNYDYYDEDGRSARQFLLRNPVPNGRLTSGYGMRRHPILGYSRMHWGVDWAGPRGTPIIAPGNGTVVRAGWNSGYGKQTVIRHANGYETSYSHQSNFAKGVKAGARVRQGQVIGYIGSTGLSTGPHLHYEMRVNGKRVNPLRVRLPEGRSLTGEQLEAFKRERDRINTLLAIDTEETTEVARAEG